MNGIDHYREIRKNFQWNVPDNFNFGRDVSDRFGNVLQGLGVKAGDPVLLLLQNVPAPYKYPRDIVFAKELPKTSSGKIRRVELRNAEWKRS